MGDPSTQALTHASARRFSALAGACVLAATALVATVPLELALASVFLFAGPHNWMEFRYAIARLPSRLSPFREFFLVAIAGMVLLTVGALAIPGAARFGGSTTTLARWATAWNLALVGWIAALAFLRSRQKPVRDWTWVLPVALVAASLACWNPGVWSLLLVYAHPIVSFVVLDRELGRHHRHWRPAYRALLAALPLLIVVLLWSLRDAGPLPGEGTDALTMRIVAQAGGVQLTWLGPRALVATLALLELLHYAVWIVVMPVVTGMGAPWRRVRVAIVRDSVVRRRVVRFAFGGLAVAVVALWVAFTADYARARDVYFTLAIAHVLGEVPMLLRLA
ncbi:MAG: hypothetical protein IT361_00640 [Gemmatimonadaceae bacterium]|nr:hypothetical protein [Gemmatimonadaceae bacterium]